MKMISSTSTTSTSGVMLISDCRLEPELLSCMISISLRFSSSALGHQPHPAETGVLDRGHGLPDLAEVKPRVPPDHDLGVRLGAGRGAQGFAELLGCDRLVVDPQSSAVVDRDQDLASLVALLGRLRRVRQVDLRS